MPLYVWQWHHVHIHLSDTYILPIYIFLTYLSNSINSTNSTFMTDLLVNLSQIWSTRSSYRVNTPNPLDQCTHIQGQDTQPTGSTHQPTVSDTHPIGSTHLAHGWTHPSPGVNTPSPPGVNTPSPPGQQNSPLCQHTQPTGLAHPAYRANTLDQCTHL